MLASDDDEDYINSPPLEGEVDGDQSFMDDWLLHLGYGDEDDVVEDDTDDGHVEMFPVQFLHVKYDDDSAHRLRHLFPEKNDKDWPQEKKFKGQRNVKATLEAFFDSSLEFPASN